MMESDLELLKQYALESVESAFAQIVQRHVNLVYSAALTLAAIQSESINSRQTQAAAFTQKH